MNAPMPKAALTHEQIKYRVRELGPWFHNLDLNGVQTAPDHFLGDYPSVKWRKIASAIATDLHGKTVLDIGCNAGFYAMEMKRRGADRVVAVDSDPKYLAQARFAAQVREFEIEFHQLSVYDIAKLGEKFDVVIFMGVLYHLRHPLLALDLIHEHVAGDLLLFQSMQRGSDEMKLVQDNYDFWETRIFDQPTFPRLYFIEKRYSNDPTNWWIPNRAGTEAILRSSGFQITHHPEAEVYLCRRVELPDAPDGPRTVYPAQKKEAL